MTPLNGDEAVPALLASKNSGGTYHGPISLRQNSSNLHLVTLTGPSEPALLRAAATWLAEHPKAVLIGLNWHDALLGPRSNLDVLPPEHRLDITVRLPQRDRF
ncbi:hypothetical protein ABZS29_17000 [Kribbella sp. NPDC005582]|uniref:hypothetical protein n=1 Tax=Kribbella sp. NPDC005582 TaxID=3156893 RepID=UPI00339F9738